MSSAQTMTSISVFQSPFRDPTNDPEALGSYTSCEGPPAQGQTSPVAKIRKHIASTFAPKPPTHTTDFLKPEPDLVSLEWVSEEESFCARARSAPPTRQNSSDMHAAPSSLDPVNASDTMNMKNPMAEDVPKQPKPSRKLRHFSSRATIADAGRAVFGSQVSEASMSIRPSTPTQTRPTTAGGDGGLFPIGDGQPGTKGCHCPCKCVKCRYANTKLCKCTCSCKNCQCKSRKLPNKILRILEGHGFCRQRGRCGYARKGEEHRDDEQD